MIKDANIDFQIHPFFFLGKNNLIDIIKGMEENYLDVVAIEELNKDIYPEVLRKAEHILNIKHDDAGIMFQSNDSSKYIFRGEEYDTKEGMQVLTIGYGLKNLKQRMEIRKIIDKGLENNSLVILDHPYVENRDTNTAGHISKREEEQLEQLCKEYNNKIALEWNGYNNLLLRKLIKITFNIAGKRIKYYDTNKKTEELSDKLLEKYNINVPVLADTDLHARNKRYLRKMGISRIITDIEGDSPKEVLDSIKVKIFSRDYKNIKNYAPAFHVLGSYCIPLVFNRIFKRPRS